MNDIDTRSRARVGLIGIVVTVAAVLVAQSFASMPFVTGGVDFSAHLSDTGGLQVGNKVVVAGVPVGKVERISIEGDKVLVDFSAKGVEVRRDARLDIKTQTVLGTKFAQLDPGKRDRLPTGDVIPVEQTTVPYALTDALGDLTNTASGLDDSQVTNALNVLGRTFDQTAPQLGNALKGVSRFSDTISSRDSMIQDLLGNAETVTNVLSERSGQINRLLLDGNTLLEALDARRSALDTLLTNISAVAVQVKGLIADNNEELTPTLAKLNQVTAELEKRKSEVASLFHPFALYGTSLGESVAGGPFFKAYVSNLLPGQFLQPFIDAAFKKDGVDLSQLGNVGPTFPITCSNNTPPGTVPPGHTQPVPNPSGCPESPQIPGGGG